MGAISSSSTRGQHYSDAQHLEIVRRLEATKSADLIVDFFVSWVGTEGILAPVIRAWKAPDVPEAQIRDAIRMSLAGIVDFPELMIMDSTIA